MEQQKIVLREYQKVAVRTGLLALKNSKKPVIMQACTAFGKSIVIANIVKELNEKTIVFQPSQEILEQNLAKYESYGYTASVFSASLNRKETEEKVIFSTIQSAYKYPELFKDVKYCIVDECHSINPKNIESMYVQFFKNINCNHILGLSATPYRLVNRFCYDGGEKYYTGSLMMLNRIHPFFFGSIIYKMELKDLMDAGYIMRPEYIDYSNGFDLSQLQVNSTGCDYTEESVVRYTTREDRIKNTIKAVDEYFAIKNKILIITSCKQQASMIYEALYKKGYDVMEVYGDTPKKQRQKIIEKFKNNEKQILINVNALNIGFDCPSLDCIVNARQIMSPSLYFQCLGRIVRFHEDKKPVFVDCTKTYNKFGKAEDYILAKEDGFKDCLINRATGNKITGKALFSWKCKK